MHNTALILGRCTYAPHAVPLGTTVHSSALVLGYAQCIGMSRDAPSPPLGHERMGAMNALRSIDRTVCDALWRMPASVAAVAIVAASISAMAALASGIVAIAMMALG